MKATLSLLAFLCVTAVLAQDNQGYSLKQAQDYAVENSYTTRNAQLDVDNARKQVAETRGIGLPQLNLSADFNYFLDIPVQLGPDFLNPGELAEFQFGTQYSGRYGATVSQLIFDGSYFVGLRASKTFVEMSSNQAQKTELDTRTQIAETYGQVLVAIENVNILKGSKENLEKILSDTRAMYENGFMEEQDVDQADLLLAGVDNNLRNAERMVENSKKMLRYQMGLPINGDVQLADDLETMLGISNGEPVLADNKFNAQSHIDFKIAETNTRLMELDLKNKGMTFVPRLSAFYNYEENTFANTIGDLGSQFYPTNLLGVRFEWAVFGGGTKLAQHSRAKIAVDQAKLMQEQVEQGTQLQAETANSNYQFAIDQYKTEKQNLELAARIRNKTLIKYQEGMSSSMDLSQSENQYLTTQGNYVRSLLDLVSAKTALDKATGKF